MTMHVFIGAGPANLDRALRIAETEPEAQLILIDSRFSVRSDKKIEFNRDSARANIFFLDKKTADSLTQTLKKHGISDEILRGLMYERQFGLEKTKNPSPSFFMIQIRDLQNLMIRALQYLFNAKSNALFLINEKIPQDLPDDAMFSQVEFILNKQGINTDKNDIKIHIATGALSNTNDNNRIIYPAKFSHPHQSAISPDLEAMPIEPIHVTATFNIDGGQISCQQLEERQQALVTTNWRDSLSKHHWNMVRPPAVRVFYAHDVLYIGAEYPAEIATVKDRSKRETQARLYLQAILNLMFPELPINTLTVNKGSGVEFDVKRGEHGQFYTAPKSVSTQDNNITIFRHGDARYLPHYQTASGFVIAMSQNELYTEIYQHKNFSSLYQWAKNKKIPEKSETEVLRAYKKLLINDNDILEAFKTELFDAASQDIIDANKIKVGDYFNALHQQELDALVKKWPDFLKIYNKTHSTRLSANFLSSINTKVAIVDLLHSNNIDFLKQVLPWILNISLTDKNNLELLKLRDAHISDYERALKKENIMQPKNKFAKHTIALANHNTEDLSRIMKQIALSLEQNKVLHRRAAISLFKGAHSDSIHQFSKKIDALLEKKSNKQAMLDAFIDFSQKLIDGKSRRTLRALEDAFETIENSAKRAHDNRM